MHKSIQSPSGCLHRSVWVRHIQYHCWVSRRLPEASQPGGDGDWDHLHCPGPTIVVIVLWTINYIQQQNTYCNECYVGMGIDSNILMSSIHYSHVLTQFY